jgi:hypothetical protein
MALVEWNQEVQTLATKALAQSLAYGVLRRSHRRPQNSYTQMGKTLIDSLREDAVPIVDDEAVGRIARQRFPELRQTTVQSIVLLKIKAQVKRAA